MTDEKAILHFPGKDPIELPIRYGTLGQPVVDVQVLGQYGFFTYDPGFMSTAACESKITYIDGDQGILLHRGYPITELVENSDYLEVCYLLLEGELPTEAQKQTFVKEIKKHTLVHEQIRS